LAGGKDLLELGCGGGAEACLFARHGYRVVATDFARSALAATCRRAERRALPVRAEQVDLRTGRLPFATASFDIVYAHLSLHYFDDATTRALFGECRRVLRPAGVLCVRCKSVDDPLYGRGEALGGERFVLDGHIRHFFSRDYLRDLLTGWQVLSLGRGRGRYGPGSTSSAFVEAVARRAA
jgi:SAM-dependent methyltransferase